MANFDKDQTGIISQLREEFLLCRLKSAKDKLETHFESMDLVSNVSPAAVDDVLPFAKHSVRNVRTLFPRFFIQLQPI